MNFSSATRGEDGLYTLTVKDMTNKQDVVMPSKYIRFQGENIKIGVQPDRQVVNQTYGDKKDAKKFYQLFAQTLQSENDFMTKMFGAVYEKKNNGANVDAVYVPVDNIKSDLDAKFVLANINAMQMPEGQLVKRAEKAYKGEPFKTRTDPEEIQVIIDAAYDPHLKVTFDMPTATTPGKDIVVDSRVIVQRNMNSSTTTSKRPAFLNKGFKGSGAANNGGGEGGISESLKTMAIILVVLFVLFFLYTKSKK